MDTKNPSQEQPEARPGHAASDGLSAEREFQGGTQEGETAKKAEALRKEIAELNGQANHMQAQIDGLVGSMMTAEQVKGADILKVQLKEEAVRAKNELLNTRNRVMADKVAKERELEAL